MKITVVFLKFTVDLKFQNRMHSTKSSLFLKAISSNCVSPKTISQNCVNKILFLLSNTSITFYSLNSKILIVGIVLIEMDCSCFIFLKSQCSNNATNYFTKLVTENSTIRLAQEPMHLGIRTQGTTVYFLRMYHICIIFNKN